MLRAMIVDDEAPARSELRFLLEQTGKIGTITEASSVRSAIEMLMESRVDVVFLDISMPGASGLQLAEALHKLKNPPAIVFVTAYSDHAVEAFDVDAVDYLMKPVDEDRLAATIERVRQRLTEKRSCEESGRLKEILEQVAPEALPEDIAATEEPASSRFEKVINIKDRGQIFRVEVADIERIDAAGDYMCIYTADQTLILRETMKDLDKRLDPRKFQRIHRSTIVNLDNVKSVKPHTNGECFLVLGSGTQVKVSRSYRDVVARFL